MTGTPRRTPVLVVTVVVLLLVTAAAAALVLHLRPARWAPTPPEGRVLVTNERDFSGDRNGAVTSPDWLVTSGTWFADRGAWWTGVPDGGSPDASSSRATGSAVLRVVSRPTFGSCTVSFRLTLDSLVTTPRTPARDYDGVHVFLRYRSPDELYAVSVLRRDGQVAVKKKVASAAGSGGIDGDGYSTLAVAPAPFEVGRVADVVVRVEDVATGVRIVLEVDGVTLLDVVDDGSDGAPPLVGRGRIGLRTDNAEAHLEGLVVEELPG